MVRRQHGGADRPALPALQATVRPGPEPVEQHAGIFRTLAILTVVLWLLYPMVRLTETEGFATVSPTVGMFFFVPAILAKIASGFPLFTNLEALGGARGGGAVRASRVRWRRISTAVSSGSRRPSAPGHGRRTRNAERCALALWRGEEMERKDEELRGRGEKASPPRGVAGRDPGTGLRASPVVPDPTG